MTPFLILQLRPERDAADDEYAAFLDKGGLSEAETHRLRLDAEPVPEGLDPAAYAGVIVGGGPGCISDAPEDKTPDEARCEAACRSLMPRIVDGDIPFLGCCYGMGLLADHLGAEVSRRRYAEPVCAAPVRLTREGALDPLLAGLPDRFDVLVGHKEAVQQVPAGAALLVTGDACPVQMIRAGTNVYATQFHPEADAEIFARRIQIYKHRGYFPPEEAEMLTLAVSGADTALAPRVLANFVRRYRRG
jgi:GMP synthase (glutamine-hydrolysing)